jgi:FKBP-type peptidyl-prolyl cis-trans isomerase
MGKTNGRISRAAATLLAFGVAVMASVGSVSVTAGEQSAVPLKAIQISFKLDSRLTDSTYGGERWVAPRTYVGVSGQSVVDVRAAGTDANGNPVTVAPEWSASNPEMISVSPARGDRVRITINRTGEGTVRAVAQGVAKELSIKATSRNDIVQIEITQLESKMVAAPLAAQPAAVDAPKTLSPAELAEKNKREGEAFLDANSKKPGVVTAKSGLQYQVVKAGNGPKPTLESTVACEYRAAFVDGTRVSGTAKDKPISFQLKAAIQAWREALPLMPAGSQWRLFVPPALAYGERGNPRGRVGPNATLVFDVSLVSIADPPPQQTAAAAAKRPTTTQTAANTNLRRRRR